MICVGVVLANIPKCCSWIFGTSYWGRVIYYLHAILLLAFTSLSWLSNGHLVIVAWISILVIFLKCHLEVIPPLGLCCHLRVMGRRNPRGNGSGEFLMLLELWSLREIYTKRASIKRMWNFGGKRINLGI